MAWGPISKQDHVTITTLGAEFATSEILGAWVGYWLDKKWDTSPWLLLGGVILGFVLGFYIILRAAKEMQSKHVKKAETKAGYR
jgi:F0F1-type ATP synthase assembly protein I